MRLGGLLMGVIVALLGSAGSALAANQTVNASTGPNVFTPTDVTVLQGETVTWNNVGGFHNVHFPDGFTEPANPTPPWTVSRSFPAAGTFTYVCQIHEGLGMAGTVTVLPAGDSGVPAEGAPAVSQLGPNKPACVSKRNFRIRIRRPRGTSRIASAKVTVNGKAVRVSRLRGRLTAPVDMRGFAGGTYEVKIEALTVRGESLHGTRRYRTCALKLASSALPRL